jgi:hypothetical protein
MALRSDVWQWCQNSLQDVQKGRPARPQRAKTRSVPLRYVEPLSDARTKLADFFSILLEMSALQPERQGNELLPQFIPRHITIQRGRPVKNRDIPRRE